MTTYIDHDIGSTPTAPAGASLIPALWSLWSLPLTTLQLWTTGWTSPTTEASPPPSEAPDSAQLPVPDELKQTETPEIFA